MTIGWSASWKHPVNALTDEFDGSSYSKCYVSCLSQNPDNKYFAIHGTWCFCSKDYRKIAENSAWQLSFNQNKETFLYSTWCKSQKSPYRLPCGNSRADNNKQHQILFQILSGMLSQVIDSDILCFRNR